MRKSRPTVTGVERELARLTARVADQDAIIKRIARGDALQDVLTALVQFVEDHAPLLAALLQTIDPATGALRLAARGRKLPATLPEALGAVPISATGPLCAVAAHRREVISVADLPVDPTHASPCSAEIAHGFRACLAAPLHSRTGELLGVLSVYCPSPGQPDAWVRSVVDVAADLAASAVDQARVERGLHRHGEAMSLMVARGPLAVVAMAPDRRVTEWNLAAERIFGWTASEAIGRTVTSLIVPPHQRGEHDAIWDKVAGGATLEAIEVTRLRRDGTSVDLAYWTSPLTGPNGDVTGAISFIADVTEQNRLKDQLLRASRMESIGRLAGGVAHDFNNLLAVISGYSESMLRRTDATHPLRTHVEEVYRAAARGAALTQQLLAFSRGQAAAPRPVDLCRSVDNVHVMLRRVISDKIVMEVVTPSPVTVLADPGQVEQVMVNLAINARDAMPGGGTLTLRAKTVTLTRATAGRGKPGKYGRLSVIDTGAGMDPEVSGRIFEPFFTTKHHPKEGGGTGLGLSIVYGIVQQSGGHLTVRSARGKGSRFDVYFPATTP